MTPMSIRFQRETLARFAEVVEADTVKTVLDQLGLDVPLPPVKPLMPGKDLRSRPASFSKSTA